MIGSSRTPARPEGRDRPTVGFRLWPARSPGCPLSTTTDADLSLLNANVAIIGLGLRATPTPSPQEQRVQRCGGLLRRGSRSVEKVKADGLEVLHVARLVQAGLDHGCWLR